MSNEVIGVGLLGFGVVGSHVAAVLKERAGKLSEHAGQRLELRKIKCLQGDLDKPQAADFPREIFTTGDDIFNDPYIQIIVEVIGGEHPAYEYQKRALESGRHVITSNKELIAKHGPELIAIAKQNGVSLLFEASVGGGIPLMAPFKYDLVANNITGIFAIINGTTNYILTRMDEANMDFTPVLAEAQSKGYAEANPENDIEGIDAAYKLAIMGSLAFGSKVGPEQIHREGISRLAPQDFRYAHELGFTIKLLAIGKLTGNDIEARVHPVFIPEDCFLAKVNGVYNAVQVEADLLDKVIFFGQGAGGFPTASAVVADIVAAAKRIKQNTGQPVSPLLSHDRRVLPMSEIITRYYLRFVIADQPGVLAAISKVLGDNGISISAAIQKEADTAAGSAEIVLTTHPAAEKAMQTALSTLEGLELVREIGNVIRIEDIK
ncbi:homoserine dehydrogenase [Chloroflexota bacterium]